MNKNLNLGAHNNSTNLYTFYWRTRYKRQIGSKIYRQISKNVQLENKETARFNPSAKM